jgi:hypothetical protein
MDHKVIANETTMGAASRILDRESGFQYEIPRAANSWRAGTMAINANQKYRWRSPTSF